MRTKLPYVYLLLAIIAPIAVILIARNCPCAKTTTSTVSHAAASSAAQQPSVALGAQLDAIDKNIDDKLDNVETPTEAMIAPELAALDDMVAHPNAATTNEDFATVLAYKARVYLNGLNMPDKAVAIYREVAAKYPGTKAAAGLDAFVAKAERWKRLAAVQATLTPGTPFPAFAVKNLQGEPLTLDQYRGKPVLVEFWATWCPYCVKQIPDIKAAYQKFHSKGFDVVGISRDRKREALVDYIAKHDMSWQQYYVIGDDPDAKIMETYGIYGIPTTFLLDNEGRIVAKNPTPAELDTHLTKLLAD